MPTARATTTKSKVSPAPQSNSNTNRYLDLSSHQRRSIFFAILLATLSLIISCVIICEILLSYPLQMLSLILPHVPSGAEVVRLTEMLKHLECHTRTLSTLLTLGACAVIWHAIFLACLSKVTSKTCSKPTGMLGSRMAVYTIFLIQLIIINDSVFNQYLPPYGSQHSLSPSLTSYPIVLEKLPVNLLLLFPGILSRFGWMAIYALPISIAEVSVVYLVGVFYTLGQCNDNARHTLLEKGHTGTAKVEQDRDIQAVPVFAYHYAESIRFM
jgi:hypothetical protein